MCSTPRRFVKPNQRRQSISLKKKKNAHRNFVKRPIVQESNAEIHTDISTNTLTPSLKHQKMDLWTIITTFIQKYIFKTAV